MPTFYESLNEELTSWIKKQKVFVVGTCPLHFGRINISPKGYTDASFTVVDANNVFYQDATGSGIETVAHIYENSRLTIMMMSFDQGPRILRLWGKASIIEYGTEEFDNILKQNNQQRIVSGRAIIWLSITNVQTSCGYGVPLMSFSKERETLGSFGTKLSNSMPNEEALKGFQAKWNLKTVDGLPGLRSARKQNGEWLLVGDFKALLRRIFYGQREGIVAGVLLSISVMLGLRYGKLFVK
eukprot:TRINITY_DN2019_c0_g1_i2.p1 TRINITY_DN2019_c0_g1~~TRINITY_DN2019_c0_g1_i2.p1  ORF type:complete len:241 (-),score=33.59 TRINITY_DN2019_c0_g1_i2:46-768(-)